MNKPSPRRRRSSARSFRKSLRALEEELRRDTDTAESNRRIIVRVTNMGGITLTAGFITWLLQSGSLLASLTATPAGMAALRSAARDPRR